MKTNRKESVAEIRRNLPYGSVKKIQVRLLEKKIQYSLQYISRCLNPDQSDYNQVIIDEAILLVIEISKQMIEMRRKIDFLNNETE